MLDYNNLGILLSVKRRLFCLWGFFSASWTIFSLEITYCCLCSKYSSIKFSDAVTLWIWHIKCTMQVESALPTAFPCVRSEMVILLFLEAFYLAPWCWTVGACRKGSCLFSLFPDICLWGFSCCSSCKNSQFWSALSCHIICQVSWLLLCTMCGINPLCNIITIIAFCLSLIILRLARRACLTVCWLMFFIVEGFFLHTCFFLWPSFNG